MAKGPVTDEGVDGELGVRHHQPLMNLGGHPSQRCANQGSGQVVPHYSTLSTTIGHMDLAIGAITILGFAQCITQGRIQGGGVLNPFWGTPKLHKEGKNVARVRAKTPHFIT